MNQRTALAPRRGRPRKVLAEACPERPIPRQPEVHGHHLQKAEEKYLERKQSELRFTNMHHAIEHERQARANHGVFDLDPPINYPSIQAYRRLELRKRGTAAADALWGLASNHHYYRLVLNVRSTTCRLYHVRRLEDVRRYVWRRISKMVTAYVRSLHLDNARYPHWDMVLAIPAERQVEFKEVLRELNRQIYGANGPGDVRIWTRRILRKSRHVEKSIDYALRVPRFSRDPSNPWLEESFRSDAYGQRLGILRRRLVHIREPLPVEPSLVSPAAISQPAKQGRPRKCDGAAYRQRRRKQGIEKSSPQHSPHIGQQS